MSRGVSLQIPAEKFIVADHGDSNIKVFDSSGNLGNHFSLPNDEEDTDLHILDVATDMKDIIYVLVELKKPGPSGKEYAVYKCNNSDDLHRKFPVKGGVWYSFKLTVTGSGRVLVLRRGTDVVDVYETDGQFLCSLGKGILKHAWDITAANDGRVIVLDSDDSCVHIFSEHGDHFKKFKLQGCYSYPRIIFKQESEEYVKHAWDITAANDGRVMVVDNGDSSVRIFSAPGDLPYKFELQGFCFCPRIAFHRASENVVVAGVEKETNRLHVETYTKDGEFARNTQVHVKGITDYLRGMTITTEGLIAAISGVKVLVL